MPEAEITEADDLYGLDPTEFTAARNALAKRLKTEGRKDDAAAVAKLRKPTATAWALNQVARDEPELVAEALDAGTRLRAATEAAVAGDPGELREAAAEDRAASDAVVDAAAALLGGRGPAARPQLAGNVRAAVLDEAVADELRRGVLAADHDAAGFGFGFDPAPTTTKPDTAAAARTPKAAATTSRPDTAAARTLKAAATTSKPDAAEARARRQAEQRERQEAEERARADRRRVADLQAEVKRLDRRHERLAGVADRLEGEAQQARAAADAAALEAEAARRALDDATP